MVFSRRLLDPQEAEAKHNNTNNNGKPHTPNATSTNAAIHATTGASATGADSVRNRNNATTTHNHKTTKQRKHNKTTTATAMPEKICKIWL